MPPQILLIPWSWLPVPGSNGSKTISIRPSNAHWLNIACGIVTVVVGGLEHWLVAGTVCPKTVPSSPMIKKNSVFTPLVNSPSIFTKSKFRVTAPEAVLGGLGTLNHKVTGLTRTLGSGVPVIVTKPPIKLGVVGSKNTGVQGDIFAAQASVTIGAKNS